MPSLSRLASLFLVLFLSSLTLGASCGAEDGDSQEQNEDDNQDGDDDDDCPEGSNQCNGPTDGTTPCAAAEDTCFTMTSPSTQVFYLRCQRNKHGWHFASYS